MANWIVLCASLLVGVWLIETVVFVLSYRTSLRVGEPPAGAELLD
jgi:hypothetical protein